MNLLFEASFARDLKRIKTPKVLHGVQQVIETAKKAETLRELPNLKKLQGYDNFYRIRLGTYRIGIVYTGNEIIFIRILHRKDIYHYFP